MKLSTFCDKMCRKSGVSRSFWPPEEKIALLLCLRMLTLLQSVPLGMKMHSVHVAFKQKKISMWEQWIICRSVCVDTPVRLYFEELKKWLSERRNRQFGWKMSDKRRALMKRWREEEKVVVLVLLVMYHRAGGLRLTFITLWHKRLHQFSGCVWCDVSLRSAHRSDPSPHSCLHDCKAAARPPVTASNSPAAPKPDGFSKNLLSFPGSFTWFQSFRSSDTF